jgi:hypothetical protein
MLAPVGIADSHSVACWLLAAMWIIWRFAFGGLRCGDTSRLGLRAGIPAGACERALDDAKRYSLVGVEKAGLDNAEKVV